jgi:hypothetical protein
MRVAGPKHPLPEWIVNVGMIVRRQQLQKVCPGVLDRRNREDQNSAQHS